MNPASPLPPPEPVDPARPRNPDKNGRHKRPPRGIPVSLQILSWFFLNLLLVGIFGFLLLSAEGGPLLNVLISGKSGERLDAIAADLAERVNGLPREKWGGILDNYSRRYKLAFALTRRDGDLQAGKVPPVPPAVVEKIREFPGTPRPPTPPPPPRRDGIEDSVQIPDQRPETRPDPDRPGLLHPEAPALSNFRFIVHEKGLYWIGVRVPFPNEVGKHRGPTTLLLVSSSLFSNGLLFDTGPLWFVAWVLLGSAVFWFPLVRRITSPLRKMRDAAELMARGHFDTRLAIHRGDEIGSLASSLNHLGERLEEFVSGQKRFLGDIAHELGSPLARMQFGLGIMEQQAPPPMQPLLEDVREEVAQMSALLQEILQFTKAGLHTELHLENIDLNQLLGKALAQENIELGKVTLTLPSGLSVRADAHLLQRAVANILRNALRYAGHAGPISVEGYATTSHVVLNVSDKGPGVPPEVLHRLCDPFFRTESARTREAGGVGLGLAIVNRCVDACGGLIHIRNRTPHGLEVEMRLSPAAQETEKDTP